ncbi:alpha/beta fold hydrolase [Planktotalea sp.]|uniref:alpha/beta hydrolase n=1 Tax=Planktotalea sp. TaxID=2029877 RepID=UPI0032990D3B
MRAALKWIGRFALLIVVAIVAMFVFGPREKVDLEVSFDASVLEGGVQAHFDKSEAAFDDIVQGTEKRVVWAGAPETKTPVSVVYIHGYSATSEEIRPVPDMLASALGANLVFTRLRGHGRTGQAMAEVTAGDWMVDTLEALAVGRAVGEKVIVVSTSTGGTLVAAAAMREDAMENVAGSIFVSPNFAINSPAAVILTWPAVRWWGPIVAGAERSFETLNEGHEAYWTNSYPTVSLMPMAALVKAVEGLDLGQAKVPALFVISDQDKVVSPSKNREVAEEWGGPSTLKVLNMGESDDPYHHVIAGDILSPGQNNVAADAMLDWANSVLGQ